MKISVPEVLFCTIFRNVHYKSRCGRGDGHRSLVTPERVLSEYNEDLNFFLIT